MESLPPSLSGKEYYHPKEAGWEKRIRERLEELRRIIRDERT
jgi:replication-associated recombination protein RarA